MSGNKGAGRSEKANSQRCQGSIRSLPIVAIRLEYYDTSFCFLTAHLAAGHSNVVERNNDYNTIDQGLRFSKGRSIKAHE